MKTMLFPVTRDHVMRDQLPMSCMTTCPCHAWPVQHEPKTPSLRLPNNPTNFNSELLHPEMVDHVDWMIPVLFSAYLTICFSQFAHTTQQCLIWMVAMSIWMPPILMKINSKVLTLSKPLRSPTLSDALFQKWDIWIALWLMSAVERSASSDPILHLV